VKEKLLETAVLVIAVAVVARVVWELLGPLLPSLVVLTVVGWLFLFVVRGHRGGTFRK
jgi:uncharacterized membrane protein YGL010W